MTVSTLIIAAVIVVALIVLISILGSLYRKVGPNRALIVYGRGGTNIVVGGGTVVMPLFQSSQEFSLELLSFDLIPQSDLYTQQGIPVKIEAVTQLKVENDREKILRAANQFLSKTQDQREGMIRQLMEGHLRGIVGQLTVEELVKEPEMVSSRMRDTVASDLDTLGLEIVSFTIKDVNDDSGYIANLSRPMIAANKRTAEISEAQADRDVAIQRATTQREAAQAEAEASQMTAVSRTQAQATQAAAQRDLDLKTAEFKQSTASAQAQAEMAGEIARADAQRKLVESQTSTELLRAQRQKDVQQAEAERKAAELVATVQRPAEAQAAAIKATAEGQAAATRAQAEAEADATKLRGFAEAQTVKARGAAEAEALAARVEATNQQQEVSLATQTIQQLPEMMRAAAEAYGKVGSVVYIGGDGDGGITSRITREVVGVVPLVGQMVQSLTGKSLADLFSSGRSAPANGKADETTVTVQGADSVKNEGVAAQPNGGAARVPGTPRPPGSPRT